MLRSPSERIQEDLVDIFEGRGIPVRVEGELPIHRIESCAATVRAPFLSHFAMQIQV